MKKGPDWCNSVVLVNICALCVAHMSDLVLIFATRLKTSNMKMKHHLLLLMSIFLTGSWTGSALKAETVQAPTLNASDMESTTINISIDGQTRTIILDNNAATRELAAALKQAPITYEATDYGNFEKVGSLGRSLTTSNQQITTQPGDVILYNGNQIVLFYGSNSWNYTRLGRIDYESLDELKSFLKVGKGRISVTLSPSGTAAVGHISSPEAEDNTYYSLSGRRVEHPTRGIYIKIGGNGRTGFYKTRK